MAHRTHYFGINCTNGKYISFTSHQLDCSKPKPNVILPALKRKLQQLKKPFTLSPVQSCEANWNGVMSFLQLLVRSSHRLRYKLSRLQCPKSNLNFLKITRNLEENEILHEIYFAYTYYILYSNSFSSYVLCYISKIRLPLAWDSEW